MIVLLGACSAFLVVMLAGFVDDLGAASAHRAHAQTAADAAALAAVVESGPFGEGRPREEAVRFAGLNGARLLECLCEPGATAAQVTVAVEGVIASARATFDPAAVLPAPMSFEGGLHPTLDAAVELLEEETGGAAWLQSGYRSTEEQRVLWHAALERYGSPELADDWVAPPGHSMHERGLAFDLGGDFELAARVIERLGLPLHRPLSHEPWHFELVGSRADQGSGGS